MNQLKFFLVIILSLVAFDGVYAQDLDKFSKHNPDSKIKMDYSAWTDVLSQYVLPVGRSKGRLGTAKAQTHRSSRLAFGNRQPSRFEGNRLFLHDFGKAHREFIIQYKIDLADIPNRILLSRLNRDEQLAYWLNLHNVLVIELLADKYPVSNLKKLKSKNWDKKVVTVEGVELSIEDIETIIMENWDDPLVLYGLYQGTIGGPALPNQAYSSENYATLLNQNMLEFINSNRGMKPGKKGRLEVSLLYEWGYRLFDNSPEALMAHIKTYAVEPFDKGLEVVSDVKFDLYDWNIADLIGGNYYSGEHNNRAAALGNRSRTSEIGSIDNFVTMASSVSPGLSAKLTNMPPGAMDLIMGVGKNNYFVTSPEEQNSGSTDAGGK